MAAAISGAEVAITTSVGLWSPTFGLPGISRLRLADRKLQAALEE